MVPLLHWLAYWLGLTDPSGGPYLWWSGAFGDITKLTLPATAIALWWHTRCHVKRCWRHARFQVPGTGWMVCGKHAPHTATPSADEVRDHR